MGPEPYRVFHLIKGLGRGGAETLLESTLAASGGGFRYGYGYFLPWKDALVGPLRERGAEVVCFPARTAAGILLRVPRVAAFLRRWRADLLHCHLPLAGAAGRLAGRLAGVPVVYTEHNLQERYHPLTRLAGRLTWRLQERVIAVSSEAAASLERRRLRRPPVRVIPNGVPLNGWRREEALGEEVRGRLGIPGAAPVVGFVGVFRRQKRLDAWLRAAAELRGRWPEARFLLVGDGPLRSHLERQAARADLGPAVRFVGMQAEVRPFLSCMDVFLLTSEFEGLPLALLEAMAMELPVVATAVGGLPEVVEEGVTGLLLPGPDPGALARAVSALLEDPGRQRAMGRAGRERVAARYSIEGMVREVEALYLETLSPGNGAGSPHHPPR